MPYIINIDSATQNGSVCLAAEGAVIETLSVNDQKDHAAAIPLFVDKLMKAHELTPEDILAIAISAGPGSYTGLRVATSIAKGLCYTWDVPLIAVNTLKMMAAGMKQISENGNVWFCPMIDARRKEVFTAIYDYKLNVIMDPQAMILHEGSLTGFIGEQPLLLAGSGAEKAEKLLGNHPLIGYMPYSISASHMAELSEEAFKKKAFEDLAYFTPFYLKGFYQQKAK